MSSYKKKIYKLFVIVAIFFAFLSVPSSVSAQKSNTVLDKITDVLIPIFGGNKKNNENNKGHFTSFVGRLARNITSNGLELYDFFSTVENDILFQPNKSFWDITKETYQEFVNQEWSLESANYYYANVPNLAGGSNKWQNSVRFTRDSVGGNLSDYDWVLKINRAVGGSFVSRATVNGLNATDFQNAVTKNNVTAKYYNMLGDYSSATYSFTVAPSVNTITISNSMYTIDDEQYITGTITGFKSERAEELANVTPFMPDDSDVIDSFIDDKIDSFFPGSLNDENSDTVYIINNTHIDNSVVENINIDEDFITNNEIIQVSDKELGDGVEPTPLPAWNDYTSVLDKILQAIKDLPKNIADKLDFPEGSGEEGGGFWSGLFGAIGDLVTGMSDFLTSMPNLVIELLDGILGLVEKVVDLFVPSAEQVEELKGSLELLVSDLTGKFDFVLEPVNQIKTVYSQPKSIYDLTIEYDEQVIHVVPPFLKSSLDKIKVLLNGSVVLFTFISIYKRFVGREDVIK